LAVVVLLAVAAAPVFVGAAAVEDAGAAAVEAAAENKLLGAAEVVAVAAGVAEDVGAGAPNNGAAALELVAAGCDGADEAALPNRLLAAGAADAAGAWLFPNKLPAEEELAGGLEGFSAPKRELPELAVAAGVGAVVCADDAAGVAALAPNIPPPRLELGAAPSFGASALVVAGLAVNILDPNVLPKLDGAAFDAVEAAVAAGG
jgi:hypothetical protein